MITLKLSCQSQLRPPTRATRGAERQAPGVGLQKHVEHTAGCLEGSVRPDTACGIAHSPDFVEARTVGDEDAPLASVLVLQSANLRYGT